VALAFGIGLLFGLERGWHTRELPAGSRAAGVRTFALTGLLGGVFGALARGPDSGVSLGGGVLLGAAFIAFAAVITAFSRDENKAGNKFSATTTVAALLAFVLGAFALLGDVRVAAAAAVVAVAVLIFREGLHGWVARITRAEFESGLVLLAMTFIALPIVPNRAVGPLGGVNPREIWIIAIILASVSFSAYIAVKRLGERRGTLVAAAVGGLVSSTAVALASARRAVAGEGTPRILVAGAALATAISFARVTVIVAALKPALVLLTAPSLLIAALVAALCAFAATHVHSGERAEPVAVPFRNPFAFWSVLGIAVAMGGLILVGRLIHQQFGPTGAIAGAATMGLFDVDAMTVAVARLMPEPDSRTAAFAVLAGVASNTLSKVAIAAIIGRGAFARGFIAISAGSVLAGGLALWLALALLPLS
jgi:uncharacterized membrane protein (DUF4010 family)